MGDCWFLSALAVVAERHDLIAKLFVDTAPNKAGAYLLRLFLVRVCVCVCVQGVRGEGFLVRVCGWCVQDGEWRHVLVDDCTSDPPPSSYLDNP